MAEQYSSFMSSGTKLFFKFQMPTLGATVEQKNGVLELTKLEYLKKWYIPIYFPNSVSGPNISKINANGPFCLAICCAIISLQPAKMGPKIASQNGLCSLLSFPKKKREKANTIGELKK